MTSKYHIYLEYSDTLLVLKIQGSQHMLVLVAQSDAAQSDTHRTSDQGQLFKASLA